MKENATKKVDTKELKPVQDKGENPKNKRLRRIIIIVLAVVILLPVIFVIGVDIVVEIQGNRRIGTVEELPSKVDAIIVPGASVVANRVPSPMLKERLDGALKLYKAGFSERILVSGDHREDNYNEPRVMARYLNEHGVPEEAIFLDHFGLDTYHTVYRAHHVFQVNSAIICTQGFHLRRAIYLANQCGFDYWGYLTEENDYDIGTDMEMFVREFGARLKAFYEVKANNLPNRRPHDPVMPITGDGRDSKKRWGEPWVPKATAP